MNFASFDFLFFFLLVYAAFRFHFAASPRRNLFLLLASLVFYMWWRPAYVLIFLYSAVSDYWIALWMAGLPDKKARRPALVLTLVNNLGLLFTFKYLDFACENANALLGLTSLSARLSLPHLVLPIGISFYTFQNLSYTLDVYRGNIPAMRSRTDFLLYASFFPQLVAGPILRARQFIPQLTQRFTFSAAAFHGGVFLICLGLAKKVGAADPLGIHLVDPVYNAPGAPHAALDVILASWAYLVQVYCDFSGYSDIAIGSALVLGFRIPANFDAPYLSTNPSEFWNRWHISLGHWVRDYVFYPLCTSGRWAGLVRWNLFVTIVVIGVWHGARWTFLVFGLYHAVLMVAYTTWKKHIPSPGGLAGRAWTACCWFVFFNLLAVGGWIFRSASVSDALTLAGRLAPEAWTAPGIVPPAWIWLAVAFALGVQCVRATTLESWADAFGRRHWSLRLAWVWFAALLLVHYEFVAQGRRAFIYFQF